MLDIGWSELLLIGVVALIVVGPKDLPHLFRSLGRFTARARSMAREFSSAMEDAAKSSGLDDAAGTLRDVKSLTSKKNLGLDALDRAADRFEKWDPKIPSAKTRATPDPAISATGAQPTASPVSAASPAAATATAGAAVSGPAKSPTPTSVAAMAEPAEPGSRRRRAVRRSDMKDD